LKIQKHPDFTKSFKKRIKGNAKLEKRTRERVKLFIENRQNPILKDHKLTGKLRDKRAFWITGDIRIVYFPLSNNEVLFMDIGSHNQVY
jgi:addiction module RelE/StbE family toxin